jgi:hypothetical protein
MKTSQEIEPAKIATSDKNAVALVPQEDREGFYRHTETVGKQYWEREWIVPDVTDHTVVNLNPGSVSGSDCENSDTLRVTVTALKLTLSTVLLHLKKSDMNPAQPLQSK